MQNHREIMQKEIVKRHESSVVPEYSNIRIFSLMLMYVFFYLDWAFFLIRLQRHKCDCSSKHNKNNHLQNIFLTFSRYFLVVSIPLLPCLYCKTCRCAELVCVGLSECRMAWNSHGFHRVSEWKFAPLQFHHY